MGILSGIGALVGGAITNSRLKKIEKKQNALADKYLQAAEDVWQDYDVPESVRKETEEAQAAAQGRSAFQQSMEESLSRGTANQLSRIRKFATSGAQALAMSGMASEEEAARRTQSVAEVEKMRQQNIGRLTNARRFQAFAEDKKWEANVNNKYLENRELGLDFQRAAMGNNMQRAMNTGKMVSGAFEAADDVVMGLATGGMAGGFLGKLYGQGAGVAASAAGSTAGSPAVTGLNAGNNPYFTNYKPKYGVILD